jgi:hypothetical protein
MPGSETVGCWKLAAPAWRAITAGYELAWCVSMRLPDEKPAVRLSPSAT